MNEVIIIAFRDPTALVGHFIYAYKLKTKYSMLLQRLWVESPLNPRFHINSTVKYGLTGDSTNNL
jgi:hypothetical protein